MRLLEFIADAEPLRRILEYIGQLATPLPISPARSPPVTESFDWDQSSVYGAERAEPEPEPEFEFDQTVSW